LDGTFDTMFDKIGVSALNGSSNLSFPQHFPRFVQYAIWQYCSEGDLDVRNGNRINMPSAAAMWTVESGPMCDRVALRSQ
jgi:hypothetical protein